MVGNEWEEQAGKEKKRGKRSKVKWRCKERERRGMEDKGEGK